MPEGDRGGRGAASQAKFRQAAFFYVHVGILYLAAVWAIHRQGMLPLQRGPLWLWFALGAAIVIFVFLGLWRWQSVWVARIVWALHALRLPALIGGAFLPNADATLPPAFYLTALIIVLINLWLLARAGWNL